MKFAIVGRDDDSWTAKFGGKVNTLPGKSLDSARQVGDAMRESGRREVSRWRLAPLTSPAQQTGVPGLLRS